MNLHLLFSDQTTVITNMKKLLHKDDTVLLLNEALVLTTSPTLNTWPCKNLVALESQENGNTGSIATINPQQWVKLSESAHLIHSWY